MADLPPELRDLATLGASELVTNVLLHTQCDSLTLTVHRDDCGFRVGVHDDNPSPVHRREVASDEEGGRGLQIVSGLFRQWGVCRNEGRGKCVWFRIENP